MKIRGTQVVLMKGAQVFFFFFLILPTKNFFLGPREAQAGLGPYLDSSLVTRLNL